MKLSSIPHVYRHLSRTREILTVLSRYGLADWLGRLGPEFTKDLLHARDGAAIARFPWETRVRLAIVDLGPTFIKLGQVLSTRPDLVGVKLAEELQHLQTNVPSDPPATVHALIQAELGQPVESLFLDFDDVPIASASIGQAHLATLKTGEKVVVKVQRADIERKLQIDLDILVGLAQWAERIPEFANYRPAGVAAEFQRTLRRELDFTRELRNMQKFAHDFADDPTIHIPHPHPALTSSRVLTMEYIPGIRLIDHEGLIQAGTDLAEVARRGANLYLKMIFSHGLYHADPHPGNIVVMKDNVIGLLDFGMTGRIDERLREEIEEAFLAAMQQDAEHLTSILTRVGATPPDLDRASLGLDVSDFIAHYGSQSLDDFQLGGALTELMELIRRYRIMLPARLAMLLKVLITLEGTAQLLNPKFSLIEVMQPYRKEIMLQQFSIKRRARKLQRLYWDVARMIEALPSGVIDVLDQVQSGKFDVHLDHRGLEPSVNRLVLGMLASAMFLGSAFLLGMKFPPCLSEISLLGAFGATASIALGLRLWRAINQSGRLDRHR
jgi:ubiquinone biosynthesis protein